MRSLQVAGSKIRAARERACLTQGQLAELIGVDRTSVTKWEGGEKSPRPQHFRALCEALGVSESTLTAVNDDRAA